MLRKLVVAVLAFFLSSTVFAQNQQNNSNSGQQEQKASENGQEMFHVFPGLRQRLYASDPKAARIAKEVRHEIAMLPRYTIFDDITFRVDGSTVTLGGETIALGLKNDAGNAVKGIEGVEKVVNNIEELPPSPMDNRIRRDVARKVFGFGGLSKYGWEAAPSIHIIVNRGNVRLVGVVDSEADKNAAGIQAKTVPGTFGVTNDLVVVPPTA